MALNAEEILVGLDFIQLEGENEACEEKHDDGHQVERFDERFAKSHYVNAAHAHFLQANDKRDVANKQRRGCDCADKFKEKWYSLAFG